MNKFKVITAIDADDLDLKLNEFPKYDVFSITIHPYSFYYVVVLVCKQ